MVVLFLFSTQTAAFTIFCLLSDVTLYLDEVSRLRRLPCERKQTAKHDDVVSGTVVQSSRS